MGGVRRGAPCDVRQFSKFWPGRPIQHQALSNGSDLTRALQRKKARWLPCPRLSRKGENRHADIRCAWTCSRGTRSPDTECGRTFLKRKFSPWPRHKERSLHFHRRSSVFVPFRKRSFLVRRSSRWASDHIARM